MCARTPFNKLKEVVEFLTNKESVIEASNKFYQKGNLWSIKKHFLLYYYIEPFLKICNGSNLSPIYIDFCSGPGACKLESGHKFLGSPIISLLKGVHHIKKRDEYLRFEKWFFIDIKKKFCSALEKRKKRVLKILRRNKIKVSRNDISVCESDCNKIIDKVLEKVKDYQKYTILAFIDPEGIKEIEWKTLEKLFDKEYVDVIYAYPTGGLKRGLEKGHLKKYMPPLTKEEKERVIYEKVNHSWYADKFVEKVAKKLKKRKIYHGYASVFNSKKTELYRILWQSSSRGAANSIKSTIGDLKKIGNKEILSAFMQVKGGQKTLTDL